MMQQGHSDQEEEVQRCMVSIHPDPLADAPHFHRHLVERIHPVEKHTTQLKWTAT